MESAHREPRIDRRSPTKVGRYGTLYDEKSQTLGMSMNGLKPINRTTPCGQLTKYRILSADEAKRDKVEAYLGITIGDRYGSVGIRRYGAP